MILKLNSFDDTDSANLCQATPNVSILVANSRFNSEFKSLDLYLAFDSIYRLEYDCVL